MDGADKDQLAHVVPSVEFFENVAVHLWGIKLY